MADWTGLAGFAGVAAALDEIQNRRVKEAALQRELTKGQGEWELSPGGGGPLGILDALMGYNPQGTIGFGSQRYQFKPYPALTERDVRAYGLTTPETLQLPDKPSVNLAKSPPGFGASALDLVQQHPEMAFQKANTNAYPFVPREGGARTQEVPLPGFVGRRMTPDFQEMILKERLQTQRDLAKIREEYRALGALPTSEATGVGGQRFVIPGRESAQTTTQPGVQPSTPPTTQPSAQPTTQVQPQQPTQTAVQTPAQEPVKPPPAKQVPSEVQASPQEVKRYTTMFEKMPQDKAEVYVSALMQGKGRDQQVKIASAIKAFRDRYKAWPPGVIVEGEEPPVATGTSEQPAAPTVDPQDAAMAQQYGAQFRKGTEAEALQTIAKLENAMRRDPANPKMPLAADFRKVEAAKRALQEVFPRGTPPVSATTGQAGTGMRVAGGPGAPKPPTTTTTTTTASQPPVAPEEFVVSPALDQTLESYNVRIDANNEILKDLFRERQMMQVRVRRGLPGASDRLRDIEKREERIVEQNKALLKEANDVYKNARDAWMQQQQKDRDKAAAPKQAKDVKVETQGVEASKELQDLTRELAADGAIDQPEWAKATEQERAIVIAEQKARADQNTNIQRLDGMSKQALSQILADEKTPEGKISADQIRRAIEQGREAQRQWDLDKAKAAELAKLRAPIGDFALKYMDPVTGQYPQGSMSIPEVEKAGFKLMSLDQQKTIVAGLKGMGNIDRINRILFGGLDYDGSITGTKGRDFEGIYKYLETGRKDTQSILARMQMNWQMLVERFGGTEMAQIKDALESSISGTLGAISRDIGGERGHFTDFDAKRIQGIFAQLTGSGPFGLGTMTASGEAKAKMRQITAIFSRNVRVARNLGVNDKLPWNLQGYLEEYGVPEEKPPAQKPATVSKPSTGGAPAPGTERPATGQRFESPGRGTAQPSQPAQPSGEQGAQRPPADPAYTQARAEYEQQLAGLSDQAFYARVESLQGLNLSPVQSQALADAIQARRTPPAGQPAQPTQQPGAPPAKADPRKQNASDQAMQELFKGKKFKDLTPDQQAQQRQRAYELYQQSLGGK